MSYLSDDLQKICAQFIGVKKIPETLKQSARQYNLRLERVLRYSGKEVEESDLKMLASFLQKSPYSKQFSPSTYISPYSLQQKFHKQIRELQQKRQVIKDAPSDIKQKIIDERLQKLGNLLGKPAMDKIQKLANIRKARKLTEKHERAEAFILGMIKDREPLTPIKISDLD
jgi:hypothetical protein